MGSPRQRNWPAVIGAALGLLGVGSYFGVVFVAGAWLPGVRNYAVPNLLLLGAGLGCSALGVRRARAGSTAPSLRISATLAAGNLLLGAAFLWLLYGMSTVPIARGPEIGTVVPDLVASNPDGSPVRLSDFRGKPLLLVFYRGHW